MTLHLRISWGRLASVWAAWSLFLVQPGLLTFSALTFAALFRVARREASQKGGE